MHSAAAEVIKSSQRPTGDDYGTESVKAKKRDSLVISFDTSSRTLR